MSIFGHVGALLDGLCLIIQCLVSAGWGDGHTPPATLSTLIFNKAVHAVTTGHRSIINTNKNCCQTLLLLLKWWLPIMLFDTTTVIKPLHHNNYTDTANIMTSITSIYSCSCYPQRITTNSFLQVVMHYLKGQILLLSLTSSILVTLKVIKDCLLRSLLTSCTVSLSLSRVYLSEVYFPLPLTGLGSTQFLGFPIRG